MLGNRYQKLNRAVTDTHSIGKKRIKCSGAGSKVKDLGRA